MKSKILVPLLALLLIIGLAGCGNASTSENRDEPGSSQETAQSEAENSVTDDSSPTQSDAAVSTEDLNIKIPDQTATFWWCISPAQESSMASV